jgi:hypothetical protein
VKGVLLSVDDKKLRNQPYAPKNGSKEEEKMQMYHVSTPGIQGS